MRITKLKPFVELTLQLYQHNLYSLKIDVLSTKKKGFGTSVFLVIISESTPKGFFLMTNNPCYHLLYTKGLR